MPNIIFLSKNVSKYFSNFTAKIFGNGNGLY